MADNTKKVEPQPEVMAVAQPARVAQPVLAQEVAQQGVAIQQPMMAQGMVAQPANHVVYVQGGTTTYVQGGTTTFYGEQCQDPQECAKIMFIVGIFFGLVSW